ncbi:MAG: flagellar hook-basal body protein [Firmicutes bacterium]|nr:flagellar hook-basal body protein [Bacillota bacterium]
MMRSLFAGVQGLRAHQMRMDVIGNNIANVNTTGFKASRVNFSDAFNQTMAGAAAPGVDRGGINARQIGLGVNVASIDTIMSDGSMELTGKATDMAIAGNGFFVMRDGGRYAYTRAGAFDFDAQGYLVNPSTGQRVQGWMPTNGKFPTPDVSTLSDIQLPVADSILAKATSLVTFDQSLNALAPANQTTPAVPPAVGTPIPNHTTAYTVIDSLGKEHSITLNFYKVADNTWDVEALDGATQLTIAGPTYTNAAADPTPPMAGMARISFNPDGSLMDPDGVATTPMDIKIGVTGYVPGGGASTMDFNMDFNKVIQPAIKGVGGASAVRSLKADGYQTGALTGFSVDAKGVVTGYYSNNEQRQVAQVALANFFNPGGLMKEGANNYVESPNSGLALIGSAGESGRGLIAPSSLEMSNVDLSAEFTNMIITQRGFQANSKIITTSDEMLQEIVGLKR